MKNFFSKKQIKAVGDSIADERDLYEDATEREIFSQPRLAKAFIEKHIRLGKIKFDNIRVPFEKIKKLYIIGSGGDYACALAAAYNAEVLCDIMAIAESLFDFIHSNPVLNRNTLVIIISKNHNEKDFQQAYAKVKESKASVISVFSDDEEKRNVISVGMTDEGELPCPSFILKYIAITMLLVHIGYRNKIITRLYNAVGINGFTALPEQLENVFKARDIIYEAADSIDTEKLSVTGISVDYAQSIYASLILSTATKDTVSYIPVDKASGCENLLALSSGAELYKPLIREAAPKVVIVPENITVYDASSICYEETIPLLNPIISTAVIRLIAYRKLTENED